MLSHQIVSMSPCLHLSSLNHRSRILYVGDRTQYLEWEWRKACYKGFNMSVHGLVQFNINCSFVIATELWKVSSPVPLLTMHRVCSNLNNSILLVILWLIIWTFRVACEQAPFWGIEENWQANWVWSGERKASSVYSACWFLLTQYQQKGACLAQTIVTNKCQLNQ